MEEVNTKGSEIASRGAAPVGLAVTPAGQVVWRMPAEPPIYQNIEETDPAAGLCHPRHVKEDLEGSSWCALLGHHFARRCVCCYGLHPALSLNGACVGKPDEEMDSGPVSQNQGVIMSCQPNGRTERRPHPPKPKEIEIFAPGLGALPKFLKGGAQFLFHASIEPWSKGSKAARGTAHVILTPSTNMYRLGAKIAVSGSPLNDTCVYSLEPHDKRKMCSDGRTFEADLCAVFECIGERIPCGSKVEVKYPAGIALGTHTEVLSRQSADETFSRECAAPQLVHSIPLQFTSTNDGLLEFAWSQPVAFAGGKEAKKFSLCHASTLAMTCPLEDVDFDDRHVIPCTGLGGDCAVWSIKLDAPQLPSCGGLLLEIDEGAVVSKDDETPNKPTIGRMTGDTPCPRWDEEKTCFLVDRDRLENEEEGLDWETRSVSKKQLHLQADLDQMHVQYSLISWSKQHLLRRLAAQSYLPRCLILPSIHNVDMEEFPQAIFDYVRVGGQLYILGSMENIDLMAEVCALQLEL
eukprot:symbB.v1.2.026700.t1/scaffold2691.1/size72881/3